MDLQVLHTTITLIVYRLLRLIDFCLLGLDELLEFCYLFLQLCALLLGSLCIDVTKLFLIGDFAHLGLELFLESVNLLKQGEVIGLVSCCL